MSQSSRRPVTVAAVVAVVVVVLFGAGAGLGGRGSAGAEEWRSRLAGVAGGSELTTADLVPITDGCDLGTVAVAVTGSCELSVPEFGGRFSLGTTKSADLVPSGPARFVVALEGATIEDDVGAGEEIELVVGRSGGTVTIVCLTTTPCVVEGLAAPEEGEA